MRYRLRQKMFSFGNKFAIKNEAGEDVFFVDGRVFALVNKLSFQDMQGRELVLIKQKMISWGPTYRIFREDAAMAVLKKRFALAREMFAVAVEGGTELLVRGSFTGFEYTFTRNDQRVAQASKRWFSLADTYGVEIADGEDNVLILACVVILDLIYRRQ